MVCAVCSVQCAVCGGGGSFGKGFWIVSNTSLEVEECAQVNVRRERRGDSIVAEGLNCQRPMVCGEG